MSFARPQRSYGRPEVIEALLYVGADWRQAHRDGPRICIGELSLQNGGPMMPHTTHREGLDCDIRPVRSDGQEAPVRHDARGYSRALTQELVDRIRNNGRLPVEFILFNDREIKGVSAAKGHDDHLHIRFCAPEKVAARTGQVSIAMPAPRPDPTSQFLKDVPALANAGLVPARVLPSQISWSPMQRSLAAIYNRLGGVITVLANATKVEVPCVVAVWYVESGGRAHTPGHAIIRFENHLFYRNWGRLNEEQYRRHFKHGSYAGQPGQVFEGHQFRENPDGAFQDVHLQVNKVGWDKNQANEYLALKLAAQLGGEDAALQSISIGGPQILVCNYRLLGYASPRYMYDAFQASERAHVLGFFDFCQQKQGGGLKRADLIQFLSQRNFKDFAKYYNGSLQVERYSAWLKTAYEECLGLGLGQRAA